MAKWRFPAPVDIVVIVYQTEETKTSRRLSAADDESRLGFSGKDGRLPGSLSAVFPPPFSSPFPSPSPPPPLSRPPLLCTSVGMYPPLNRSGRAAAGSLTAQRGSSINQRHFQCPITETALLGLSGADSSPIHLLSRGGAERRKVVGWREGAGGREKAIVACRSPFTCSNGGAVKSAGRKTPPKLFSLGQENNKKR